MRGCSEKGARVALMAVLLTALAATLPAAAEPGAEGEHTFFALIDQRLALMRDVAAHKWHNGMPIEDLEREALVVDQAVGSALRHGLTVGSSRAFFAAQIEAAKEIQRHWFDVWQSGPPPAVAPDLDVDLRPELLRLGSAIVDAAAKRLAAPSQPAQPQSAPPGPAAVHVEGLSADTRRALLTAARALELYPHRLAQILDSGVLRIGTTGDYAPFSHRDDHDAEFRGIDIDLGRQLAQTLGVAAVFVQTSWPTLTADLAAGDYDIGMGGISRLAERQRHGFLSVPYYVAGKTPIARCDEAEHFKSLAAIDRPGVRVVVNPGGTNQQFVDAHIHRADKLVHADNRTIFNVLLQRGADVMITDRVEVELQTALHDELCATMPDDLNYQDKAYLMPQDSVWKAFVDLWLELALADGTVAAIVRRHGVGVRLPGNDR
jgi:cyclohexadienyl dehydratase